MKKEKEELFILTDTQEEYLKIYHEYFVLHWTHFDICKYHNCSKTKVTNGIAWVIKNKIEIPSKSLYEGAIDSLSTRLSINKKLFDAETAKKRYVDKTFIIALSKEIREDEKLLSQLHQIYSGDAEDDNKLNAGQVLNLILKANEKSN